jgi:hypothetical protein
MIPVRKNIFLALAFSLIIMSSTMINQQTYASSTNPFTVQDAPVPVWNLTRIDNPLFFSGGSYGGGWQMSPNLVSDVMEGTLHLRIFVDYTISCMDTVTGAASLFNDQTPLQGLGSAHIQQVLGDTSNIVIRNDIEDKSKILIYQTSPQGTLHPQCDAEVIVQDQTHPNWLYWIHVYGNGFASASDLQDGVTIIMVHCETLIQNKSQSNTSPTPTPTPTPISDDNSRTQEHFIIQDYQGDVTVQRGGVGSWIPATKGMLVYPFDAIKTNGLPGQNWVNIIFSNENATALGQDINDYKVELGDGTIILLSSEKVSNMITASRLSIPKPTYAEPQTLLYVGDSRPQHIPFRIETPDAIISDTETEFQVIVNSTGTTVYTLEGTVEVSDLDGLNTVQIDAGQTITLHNGVPIGVPIAFNVNSIDKWWTTTSIATQTPTGTPSNLGSTDSPLQIFDMLPLLGVVAVIILVVVVVGVVWSKRRKKTTQTDYLPPPPPP